MKTIRAKVVDPMHLELSQPVSAAPGESIDIVIVETQDDSDERDWRGRAKEQFLKAYDDQDAIYDEI
jgi:hypothetical protein